MNRTIKFSKLYIPAAVLSSAIMLSGIVGYFIFGGFNLGVDFRAGINETVRLALPAMEVTYSGEGTATLDIAEKSATLVIVQTKNDDKTVKIPFDQFKTVGELAAALNGYAGVKATVKGSSEIGSGAIIAAQQGTNELSAANALIIHRSILTEAEKFASIEQIRKVAESISQDAAVQIAGDRSQQTFLIRIQDKGADPNFSENTPEKIKAALGTAFGADKVLILQTNIVGASYSANLSWTVSWVMALAVLAILIYAMIRFEPKFAIGAVLAIVHDALIMVAFVVWSRLEFNSNTIAALLTVLGYSINDTIVIFDRIREDKKLYPDMPFRQLVDFANTVTLGRTIITSLTTMLCVVTLFLNTSGSMKDFALVLIVGMTSGVYSTIYIATAFTVAWDNIAKRIKGKKEMKPGKAELKPAKA
jgi:preprotein translocase subunit SecF